MIRLGKVPRIKFIRTNKNLSDLLTKFKTFNQEFSDVFRRGLLDQEVSRVEIRLVPREHGDELRIFSYGVEEKSEPEKDPWSIT